ncbi:methyltransferase [Streptomyces sp. NPDC001380]|uniref:methyltransferase n=1 Tax=Streptomyces sp. NPDC001380 TaxID=3364566 RepID=UPI003682A765
MKQRSGEAGGVREPWAGLVAELAAQGALDDPAWRTAFEEVPRHAFVPAFHRPLPGQGWVRAAADDPDPRRRADWARGVYEDTALVLRLDGGAAAAWCRRPLQTARLLDGMQAGDGQRVLEVGTGSGYGAALLAHRLGAERVFTVGPGPAEEPARRLADAGYGGVTAVSGDTAKGWPAGAPYDRVVVAGDVSGPAAVSADWVAQCRPGAAVLVPVGGALVRLRVAADGTAAGRFLPVPVRLGPLHGPPGAGGGAGAGGGRDGTRAARRTGWLRARRSRTGIRPEGPAFLFALGLARPELEARAAYDRGRRSTWLTVAAPDGSTARAAPDGAVSRTGPQEVWPAVEELHDRWTAEGRPGWERFGLTLAGDRQWAWLDRPDRAWAAPGRPGAP